MEDLRILYKYTTRSRRENFMRGVKSIIDNSDSKNFCFLISVENAIHDAQMFPLPNISHEHVFYVNPGNPTTKIDAINRDINFYTQINKWDILVNMSDDMFFNVKGFDNIIRSQFIKENSLDLFLHFPDGNQKNLATMSIIGKTYFDRDKYIYHPDYKSLYSDNEAQEVAINRGSYRFIDQILFNHLHPAYGKALYDSQYIHTESLGGVDKITYERRKSNGFN